MAETTPLAREYTIPLRRHWKNVQQYNRTAKAVKAIKQFLAKHMKVTDRNPDLVKMDVYFNNELWFRGRANPPAKITVKAIKEGEIVQVTFVKQPDHVAFAKTRHAKVHKQAEKKAEAKEEAKTEQTPEQKKDEQEKEQASAQQKATQIKQDTKAQQKATKVDKAQHPQRMALKK
jgi:large subunit ribosomal protein L31e